MKKYSSFILMLFFVQQAFATSFYEQLCEFNSNWKKYKLQAPAGNARNFESDKDYVQAHLSSVLTILRSNPVDHLNAKQYDSRMRLIELLDAYCLGGNVPVNYQRFERIPVFIDEHNTYCAVGYLMQQTGHEDMAKRIAAAGNYAWLKDIRDPELHAWQNTSGFTIEELKLIQGYYDFYEPRARYLPNKYEIPQKPECVLLYFENKTTGKSLPAKQENIWCKGEGKNGVLHGRWVQNYAVGMPWIVGYYDNGKRSGQWEEYYQGTKQLCRTEVWWNDKLNGVRKRFDRAGNLIEEIQFKNGVAVTKTNYDLEQSLKWVRKPLPSDVVYTEVFTIGGALLASGHEKVHNPGNLQWFQNIELTALNSAVLSTRYSSPAVNAGNGFNPGSLNGINLYNTPPLVEYKKEGEWIYYKEYNVQNIPNIGSGTVKGMLMSDYRHFGNELRQSLMLLDDISINSAYDSIRVIYSDNNTQDMYGYGAIDYTHFKIRYYDADEAADMTYQHYPLRRYRHLYPYFVSTPAVKECGLYTKANEKIGIWKHFNKTGDLYKTENYLIAWKEDEEEIVKVNIDNRSLNKIK